MLQELLYLTELIKTKNGCPLDVIHKRVTLQVIYIHMLVKY